MRHLIMGFCCIYAAMYKVEKLHCPNTEKGWNDIEYGVISNKLLK